MFTEALRCFLEATDNNRSCSAADLAPALTKSLHITKQFLPTTFFGGNNSSELYVNWTECEGIIESHLFWFLCRIMIFLSKCSSDTCLFRPQWRHNPFKYFDFCGGGTHKHSRFSKISNTRCLLKWFRQTAQTQIRLLLKKQSDQGFLSLLAILTCIL